MEIMLKRWKRSVYNPAIVPHKISACGIIMTFLNTLMPVDLHLNAWLQKLLKRIYALLAQDLRV